jgi:hypothetical protein
MDYITMQFINDITLRVIFCHYVWLWTNLLCNLLVTLFETYILSLCLVFFIGETHFFKNHPMFRR